MNNYAHVSIRVCVNTSVYKYIYSIIIHKTKENTESGFDLNLYQRQQQNLEDKRNSHLRNERSISIYEVFCNSNMNPFRSPNIYFQYSLNLTKRPYLHNAHYFTSFLISPIAMFCNHIC